MRRSKYRMRTKKIQKGGDIFARLKLRKNRKDVRVFELTDEGIQWFPGPITLLGSLIPRKSKKKSMKGRLRYIDYNDITYISSIDVSSDKFAIKFRVTYDDDGEERTLDLDNNCHPCDASFNPGSVRLFHNTLMKIWKRISDQDVLDTLNVPRGSPRPGQLRRQTTNDKVDAVLKSIITSDGYSAHDHLYGTPEPTTLSRRRRRRRKRRKSFRGGSKKKRRHKSQRRRSMKSQRC